MSKLLLIDDDKDITSLLKELLQLENFDVEVANNGQDALNIFDNSFDLVLLDIMMPGMNGLNVLTELRKQHTVPVIFLTAKDSDLDRIIGLELGADDYIIKPFNDRELIARVRALLRRHEWDRTTRTNNDEKEQNQYTIDKLSVNIQQQTAYFDGVHIELTGTEFQVLQKLLESKGKIISRNTLSESVLGKTFSPLDRSVDVHVSNLRKKLPERSDGLPWIKTLRAKGYLFIFDKDIIG